MSERVLCVISGFPASGKTTLLNSAIAERMPLFGLWSDHLFSLQRWCPTFERMSGLEHMAVTPVEYRWIGQAISTAGAEFPPRGVLHMDLSVASDLQHFAYDWFRDPHFLSEQFEARLDNLFLLYDKVILNTIKSILTRLQPDMSSDANASLGGFCGDTTTSRNSMGNATTRPTMQSAMRGLISRKNARLKYLRPVGGVATLSM